MARLLREQCQSKTGAPTQKLTYSQLTTMCRLGWLRRHPRKAKPFNTKYCINREQQQDIF
ncbi:hypothetical protein SATG_02520 [Staphylococcus aureus subsp. aureus D139]|nr:hypothetical protein SATG_02520 [Staphylococcus aureus subsp. aureus D139]KIT68254.1 hypothetical protein QP64_11960 [Staphylococcus aureus]